MRRMAVVPGDPDACVRPGSIRIWPEMADRWSYLPLIGLFVALVWGFSEGLSERGMQRIAGLFALTILLALAMVTRYQLGHWHDSVSLFRHTLMVCNESTLIHNNLGAALEKRGDSAGAMMHYRRALEIDPNYADAHMHIGNILLSRGNIPAAVERYTTALQIAPNFSKAHYNMGVARQQSGDLSRAMHHYQAALRLDPDSVAAHNNLGAIFVSLGQLDKAVFHFRQALSIEPNDTNARGNLLQIMPGALRSAQ